MQKELGNKWYDRAIKADSPFYRNKIKNIKEDKTKKEVVRLFQYIKSNPRMTISLFHGTSTKIWENIQKSGFFSSPKIRNVGDREARTAGLEEVFFTTQINYAFWYANRSSEQDESTPIILYLEIPIIWIKEVSEIILNPESSSEIYNEFGLENETKLIIENPNFGIEEKAENILNFFINQYLQSGYDEFTIKHIVPIRFVKATTLSSKKFLSQSLEAIVSEKDPQKQHSQHSIEGLIPQEWKEDEQIREIFPSYEESEHISSLSQSSYFLLKERGEKEAEEYFEKLISFITDPSFNRKVKNLSKSNANNSETFASDVVRALNDYIYDLPSLDDLLKKIESPGSFINELINNFSFFRKVIKEKIIKDVPNRIQDLSMLIKEDLNKDPLKTKISKLDISYFYKTINTLCDILKKHSNLYKNFGFDADSFLSSFINENKQTLRECYLNFIRTYSSPSEEGYNTSLEKNIQYNFGGNGIISQPPLEQDQEALSLYNAKNRELYLEEIKQAASNDHYNIDEEWMNELSKEYNQPEISSDVEAQRVFSENIIKRLSKSRRRDGYGHSVPKFNKMDTLGKNVLKNIYLPQWILDNPEMMKNIRDGYQNLAGFYIDTYANDIDEESLHPALRRDENGPISYRTQVLKEMLLDDSKGFPNMAFVSNDPELLLLYKNKLKKIIKNEEVDIAALVFAYNYFGSKNGFEIDPEIKQQVEQKIPKYIEKRPADVITKIISDIKDVFETDLGRIIENILIQISKDPGKLNSLLFSPIFIFLMSRENYPLMLSLYRIGEENILSKENITNIEILLREINANKPLEKLAVESGKIKEVANNLLIKKFLHTFSNQSFVDVTSAVSSVVFSNIYKWTTKTSEFYERISEIFQSHIIKISEYFFSIIGDKANFNKNFSNLVNYLKDIKTSIYYFETDAINFINKYLEKTFDSIITKMLQIFIIEYSKEHQKMMSLQKYDYSQNNSLNSLAYSIIDILKNKFSNLSDKINNMTGQIQAMREKEIQHNNDLYQKATYPQQPQVQNIAKSWYSKIKTADDWKNLSDIDADEAYDKFKKTYDDATGWSWSKEQFLGKAGNWRFYGDNSGYIAVREQNSGMLKLVGMAGSMKGIYRGMQELLKETQPIWGAVTKNIADMAKKVGFETAEPLEVQNNINKIPSNVFGNARIQGVQMDGGINFIFPNGQTAIKYLIGNSLYFSNLRSMKSSYSSSNNSWYTLAKSSNLKYIEAGFDTGHWQTKSFRDSLSTLPSQIQQLAFQKYQTLLLNPQQVSIKQMPGNQRQFEVWSAQVGNRYRALSVKFKNQFIWYWIGSHEEYNKIKMMPPSQQVVNIIQKIMREGRFARSEGLEKLANGLASKAQLVKAVIAARGTLIDNGSSVSCIAPSRSIWNSTGTHELSIMYERGWKKSEVYGELLADIQHGISPCDDLECDWCSEDTGSLPYGTNPRDCIVLNGVLQVGTN